jgi:hypothetical protein
MQKRALSALLVLGALGCAESRRHTTTDGEPGPVQPKTEPHVGYLAANAYQQCADGLDGVVVASSGEDGIALARLAASGAVDWTLPIGTGTQAYTSLGGIAVDGDGNVYIAGSFDGTLILGGEVLESTRNPGEVGEYDDPHGQSSSDVFLCKLNREGMLVWIERFGGIADQRALELAYAPDGSLALAVSFFGRLELGAHTYLSSGGVSRSDLLLARLDLDGRPLAARSFVFSVNEFSDLTFDRDGSLLAAGYALFGARETELGDLPDAGWVAKFDADFEPLWLVTTDDQDGPDVRAIATDSQSNVLLATVGYDNSRFFGRETGEQGVGVAKLAPDGQLLFARSFGSLSLDYASGVAVLSNDDFAVAGSYYRTIDFGGGPLVANAAQTYEGDVFVTRFDADGEYLAGLSLGAPGADYPNELTALPDDTLVLSSYTAAGPTLDVPRQGTGNTYVAWLGSLL